MTWSKIRSPWVLLGVVLALAGGAVLVLGINRDSAFPQVTGLLVLALGVVVFARGEYLWQRQRYTDSGDDRPLTPGTSGDEPRA